MFSVTDWGYKQLRFFAASAPGNLSRKRDAWLKNSVGRNPTNGFCFDCTPSFPDKGSEEFSNYSRWCFCFQQTQWHLKYALQVKVPVALAWTVAELYLVAKTLEVDNHIKDLTHVQPSNNPQVLFEKFWTRQHDFCHLIETSRDFVCQWMTNTDTADAFRRDFVAHEKIVLAATH